MKGYRTILLNLIATIGMLVTLLTGVDTKDGVTVIQDQAVTILNAGVIAWGILSIWLRALTDTPIFWGNDAARTPTRYRR